MRRPSVADLPPPLAGAARAVARRLARAGKQGWIVGGAVRDLGLGIPVKDLDLASAATPEEVEELFPHAKSVGRAFGTMLVTEGAVVCQLTTFRSEAGYGDARRPDEVSYGRTLEEDARRRDFTVNALYLDPLTDELRDPEGGAADLDRRLLRCVGEPAQRFREDGLRILRLARLAASRDLEVDPPTAQAAAGALDALRGVSRERVYEELRLAIASGRGVRALELLEALDATRAVLGADVPPGRLAALRRLGRPTDAAAFLGVLLGAGEEEGRAVRETLLGLRPPRDLVEQVGELGRELVRLAALLAAGSREPARRAPRIRLVRTACWERVLAVARALDGLRYPAMELEELAAFARGLTEEELRPVPLVDARDLSSLGLPRGPAWKELLDLAEDERLDGRHASREEALAWLRERVRERTGR